MYRLFTYRGALARLAGIGRIAFVLAAIALSGCNACQWRGEGFESDPLFDSLSSARPTEPNSEFFGVSNKARQIEQHMGFGG